MTVTVGSLVVAAVLALAGWATVALCVSAVVAVLEYRERRPARPVGAEYAAECPFCRALSGRACRRVDGEVAAFAHPVRAAAAVGAVSRDGVGEW